MRNPVAIVALLVLSFACIQDPPSHPDPENAARRPDANQVLTLSETQVTPGQVVEVRFDPPPEHEVWGVDGELWRKQGGEWRRLALTWGWLDKPRMFTYWPKSNLNAFPAIAFAGTATWEWRVPGLRPGLYELRKEWLPKAPPSPDRPVVTERAAFTVME